MLSLVYLTAAGICLALSRASRGGWFLQIFLLGLGAFVPANWHKVFILLGLAYFGQWDLAERAVPARLFDAWCLVVAIGTPHPHWAVAAAWLITLGALAKLSGGMGSADVFAISVLAFGLPLDHSLLLVLIACLSGLAHYAWHHGTVPLLFHLQIAYLLLALMQSGWQ
ncbi:hypothetical protein [Lacticaseibacillus camelliae]|uniref:Prepilin type IV endopeptidase peptidase domain-containing protein n=2 Tax=Lacticaseibacillus camelliae TaxID=381742 RepID=A0A0R2EQ35_9LACO|nr:hypothetical protein [Lacticaseibacillus camelliae]KRN18344.1 hypothetical protein FC75_GL000752 [Lacticaseibacillus camelliae DSM 22697 = JCM 13995]